MNLLERALALLRANLDIMAEKSDEPEKALRQIQLDMRNQLVQVKTQVATAIAEGMKLQKNYREKQTEANLWLKKAEQAIQQGNENAARDFLSRYNGMLRQIARYQQQQKEQDQLTTTMRGILRQLEAKIVEVDTTIEILAARKRNALLQQRIYDTLSKSGSPKDRERALQAQDALIEIEARARALADIQQHDLDVQLEHLSHEQLIDAQVKQLKNKTAQPQEKPLLREKMSLSADLAAPLPQPRATPRKRVEGPAPRNGHTSETPGEDLDALRKLMDN